MCLKKVNEDLVLLFSGINTFKITFTPSFPNFPCIFFLDWLRIFFLDWLFRDAIDRFAILGHKISGYWPHWDRSADRRLHTRDLKNKLLENQCNIFTILWRSSDCESLFFAFAT